MTTTIIATKDMVRHCFDVLHNKFDDKYAIGKQSFRNDACGLFITLRTASHALRGCMGSLKAIPLYKGLTNYTIISAFNDPRFPDVKKSELSSLNIEVSLIYDKEDITNNGSDWVIGTHGLAIEFKVNGKEYNATYLPDVAREQHWSKEAAVHQLIRKAGYDGPITNDVGLFEYFRRYRYLTSKASMNHDEYVTLTTANSDRQRKK